MKGKAGAFEEEPYSMMKTYNVNLLAFPQRIIQLFTIVHCRRGINQTFEGLLETGCKLKLILGNEKFHCDIPVIVKIDRGL